MEKIDTKSADNAVKTHCGEDGCAACSMDLHAAAEPVGSGSGRGWLRDIPRGKALRLAAGIILFALLLSVGDSLPMKPYLYLAAYLVLGYDVLLRAFRWKGKKTFFDEHFLMTVATLGAFAIGEFPEAVAVMLFYQAGEMLQVIAVGHSRRSIKALQAIKPDQANLITEDGVVTIEPESVAAGATILIRPGERVPLDSLILEGESEFDTAALTGESLPRSSGPDDEIMAGSINGSGKIAARVLRPAADSAVSRILHLVEQAAARKAPAEKFISRFAAVYTPLMLGLALVIAFLVPALFSLQYSVWIYRALIILVVSCPCALVISVPLGYFAGLGVLARKGLLVKGGTYIETLARTRRIALDKTGTLTEGDFTVAKLEAYGISDARLLELAAAAEDHSHHPLAKSLKRHYQQQTGRLLNTSLITSYREYPGKGIAALYGDQEILAGSHRLMNDNGIEMPAAEAGSENGSGAILYIAADRKYAGKITMADRLKNGIRQTIEELNSMDIELMLLSGDRKEAVAAAADDLRIGSYRYGLMPDDKVAALEAWMTENSSAGSTVYVGDGINDAPVLTRADAGIAMGNGSDAATENADGVLVSGDINKLPGAIKTAKKTARIIRQNVGFAIGFKALILILAMFGLSGIWQAVFADVGVTMLAVLNSLRLLSGYKKART